METNQGLLRLGPSIRLLRRQVREWTNLMVHQRQVRLLIGQHTEQQTNRSTQDRAVVAQQLTTQKFRLNRVLRRQCEERQQLRIRHQQEKLALEHAIDTHESS